MRAPLIAIVGDISANRVLDPALKSAQLAMKASEQIGAELARQGLKLLVYGGPFLEEHVVRGFIGANPRQDRSVLMWYTKDNEPPAFPEEKTHPKQFERRADKGQDWETAFYRSLTKAEGIILIGGGNATKISGQVAIGSRMPILALPEFGGGAAKVWDTLSAGEDLPSRDDINTMARPWDDDSASRCVDSLLAQIKRRRNLEGAPSAPLTLLAAIFFVAALAIIPWVWGQSSFNVWMLFFAPLLAGGAGAALRPAVDRLRGTNPVPSTVLATIVLGLVAGGIAGVLFVTAQLTGDPQLASNVSEVATYARRSIPFAMGIGFVAGLTADGVFGKLLGLDVARTAGMDSDTIRP